MYWLKSPGKGHSMKKGPEREQRAEPGSVCTSKRERTKEEGWEYTGKASSTEEAF